MILRSAPASPFVRKVRMSAILLGLADRIELVRADTGDPDGALLSQNPLAKIPVLITDDGAEIYDSLIICEYLDALAGGTALFPAGDARWPALTLHSLATGMMDAGLLQIYEGRYRPEEKRHEPWLARQQAKIDRALARLDAEPPALDGPPHIGQLALAAALGHLGFRFAEAWREGHPRLVDWLATFAAEVPAYGETMPHD